MEKPKDLLEEHLEYLDELRESGVTNMFGAAAYLADEFLELNIVTAKDILAYWIKSSKKDITT